MSRDVVWEFEHRRMWSGAAVLAIVAVVALGAGAFASHERIELSLPGESELAHDAFGASIAVDGDRAVVGASDASRYGWDGIGAAFEYAWNGEEWYQLGRITPPGESSAVGFGSSVALEGDTLLVGAERSEVDGKSLAGAVYEYAWDGEGWNQQGTISMGSVAENRHFFGSGVALDGDVALIGAEGTEVSGQEEAGEAYVFEKRDGEWQMEDMISLSVPNEGAHFGSSVALESDLALIGADAISGKHPDQGIVYEYRYDGDEWEREDLIQLDLAEGDEHFGASLSLDGDEVLIGAPRQDVGGEQDAGAAYRYEHDGDAWERQGGAITRESPGAHEVFGSGVAFGAAGVLVGAPGADIEDQQSVGAVYALAQEGDDWVEQRSHDVRGEALADSRLGASVAVGQDRVLAGSTARDAVYVFVQDASGEWRLEAKLSLGGSASALAVEEDTVLIGSSTEDAGGESLAGAAYIFTHDGYGSWTQQQRIPSPEPQSWGHFGTSVALEEGTAVVGHAEATVDGEARAGMVHVYRPTGAGWSEQTRIESPNPDGGAEFGTAVDLEDGTLLVGAHDEEVGGEHTVGAAYLFTEGGQGSWEQSAHLVPPEPEEWTRFGADVALAGGTVVVGASHERVGETEHAGAVHVIAPDAVDEPDAWRRVENPRSPDEPRFGSSLAFDGDVLLVGAPREDGDGGVEVGTAYTFMREEGWIEQETIANPRPDATDRFASSVTLAGDTAVIAATGEDRTVENGGAVYLYPLDTLTASFSYDPTGSVGPSTEVQFTDESGGSVVDRSWRFGETGSSSEANPAHTFPEGSHEVCLLVTDAVGHEDEACHTVVASGDGAETPSEDGERAGPTDDVAAQADADEVTVGDVVTFTADGDASDDVRWDFGDGRQASGPHVTHAYDAPGTYTVTLTTTDEDGQTTTQSLRVEVEEDGLGVPWLVLLLLVGLAVVGVVVVRGRGDGKTPEGGPGQSAYGSTPDEIASKTQSADTESFCADCGSGLPVGAAFCPDCGAQTGASSD